MSGTSSWHLAVCIKAPIRGARESDKIILHESCQAWPSPCGASRVMAELLRLISRGRAGIRQWRWKSCRPKEKNRVRPREKRRVPKLILTLYGLVREKTSTRKPVGHVRPRGSEEGPCALQIDITVTRLHSIERASSPMTAERPVNSTPSPVQFILLCKACINIA